MSDSEQKVEEGKDIFLAIASVIIKDTITPREKEYANDNLNKLGAYIRELEDHQRWIPVNEGLPKRNEICLLNIKNNSVSLGNLLDMEDGVPIWNTWDPAPPPKDVTHWMRIPPDPTS